MATTLNFRNPNLFRRDEALTVYDREAIQTSTHHLVRNIYKAAEKIRKSEPIEQFMKHCTLIIRARNVRDEIPWVYLIHGLYDEPKTSVASFFLTDSPTEETIIYTIALEQLGQWFEDRVFVNACYDYFNTNTMGKDRTFTLFNEEVQNLKNIHSTGGMPGASIKDYEEFMDAKSRYDSN